MTGRVAAALGALVVMVVGAGLSLPNEAVGAGKGRPTKSPAELAAEVLRSLREYRATLAEAVPIEEAALQEARDAFDERRSLHAAGMLPVSYVEAARRRWELAEKDLHETRTALDEVDHILQEVSIQQELAQLRPLRPGGYEETATLVRFNGSRAWSLGDVPKLVAAFERALGRRLPISALGQTPLHTRLGFDHHKAIDVAVHPDSADGQWLMKHLRDEGIPFIAARGAIAGSSTGAHIHIGLASMRTLAR